MHGALRLARRARGVVHDRVVVAGGGERGELVGRRGHQLAEVEVARDRRLLGAPVLVDDDDVLERRQLRQDGGHLLAQLRLRHEDGGAAVLEAVPHGIGPERGEERPDDAARFERAEDGEVDLGHALHEREDALARRDAEAREHVGEAVRLPPHVVVGVGLRLAALALPEHRRLVRAAVGAVAVDRLVGDVQPAAGQPIELPLDLLPLKAAQHRPVVGDVRGDGEAPRLVDHRMVHSHSAPPQGHSP